MLQVAPHKQRREIVPQVFGVLRQERVVEHEPQGVLNHPNRLARPIGRGIEGPPHSGGPAELAARGLICLVFSARRK